MLEVIHVIFLPCWEHSVFAGSKLGTSGWKHPDVNGGFLYKSLSVSDQGAGKGFSRPTEMPQPSPPLERGDWKRSKPPRTGLGLTPQHTVLHLAQRWQSSFQHQAAVIGQGQPAGYKVVLLLPGMASMEI